MGMSQLISELNGLKAYFTGKKTEIETAVAVAQAAVLANQKIFWVHPTNGSDTNAGTEAAPFATIKKAVDSVPVGGTGNIWLAPVAGLEYLINSDVTVVCKRITLLTSLAATDHNAFPVIRQARYVDTVGKHATYGFLLFESALVIRSINLETTTLPDLGVIGSAEGLFKRQDYSSGSVFVMGSRITVRDTALARRPQGPATLKIGFYAIEIIEAGALRQGKVIESESMPVEFGANLAVLPAGRGWKDLIGGIVRYSATGIPRNIISNVDLSESV